MGQSTLSFRGSARGRNLRLRPQRVRFDCGCFSTNFGSPHYCTAAACAFERFAASHAAVRDRMYSMYSWLVFSSGMV